MSLSSTQDMNTTIFALSSAAGRAGVAVFRLSGPNSAACLEHLSQRPCPPPRRASLRRIFGADGGPLDDALLLWFPAPQSFTGEDCAEIQCHGSVAVIDGLAEALLAFGARQAGPGEFTRRAVENGKMDLTEAEGLADLIDAETRAQRAQAMSQMDGHLRTLYEGWQSGLLDAMAQIEGEIDFADEADVPDALSHAAWPDLDRVAVSMEAELARFSQGYAVRTGIEIAILGAPNAGKSTLMNQIARREIAITSAIPGTTRDVLEAQLRLGGLPVTVLDTAGLRETADAVEAEGVRRAVSRASKAQYRILVWRPGLEEQSPDIVQDIETIDYIYINKSDTYANSDVLPNNTQTAVKIEGNALSGESVDTLLSHLSEAILREYSGGEHAGLTRQRHADLVRRAFSATRMAQVRLGQAPELASEDIRAALLALDELAGRADIEQVFDRIFSRFCIGK